MKTANADLIEIDHLFFSKIIDNIDEFPASTEEPTMLYDHNKLLTILMEKELNVLEKNVDLVKHSNTLSGAFGQTTSTLHKDPEKFLREYHDVLARTERELSGNMYIYARQWGLSVKALYYYKKGDYQGAFSLTLECIALTEFLIRQGANSLLFRCAEQNRNISKILLRQQQIKQGAGLGGDILCYLLTGRNKLLYGSVFSIETWNVIPYVREGYAYGYFRGLVHLLSDDRIQRPERAEIFLNMFQDLSFDTNTIDRLIIYNWIYLKQLEVQNQYGAFLEGFIEFMQEPMNRLYDIVKIALFKDVKNLLNKSDFPYKELLFDKMEKYMSHKMKNAFLDPNVNTSGDSVAYFKIPIPGVDG